MFHRRLSFLLVALCAACGSNFQSTGDGGGGDSAGGGGNAPGASGTGTGADAGDTSTGGTGDAGDAGAPSGGTEPGGGSAGQPPVAGAGGLVLPNGGSGGTVSVGGFGTAGSSAGNANAGSGGDGTDTCTKLRAEYLALVDAARVCEKGSTDQCHPKYTLPSATACGCAYLINGTANTEKAQARYQELEKNGCLKAIACPQVFCAVYKSASCQQSAGTKATFVCTGDGGGVAD